MALQKVLIKVINDDTDQVSWEHIAYADSRLYKHFLKKMGCSRSEFAEFITKWAKQDFNIDLLMAHKNDILILKRLIKDRYKKAQPYVYIETETDRQGWVRVWLTRKMMEELKLYGKRTEV